MGSYKSWQATEASGSCMHDLQREEDKVRSRRAKMCPVRKVWQRVQIHNSVSLDLNRDFLCMGCLVKPIESLADHIHL